MIKFDAFTKVSYPPVRTCAEKVIRSYRLEPKEFCRRIEVRVWDIQFLSDIEQDNTSQFTKHSHQYFCFLMELIGYIRQGDA